MDWRNLLWDWLAETCHLRLRCSSRVLILLSRIQPTSERARKKMKNTNLESEFEIYFSTKDLFLQIQQYLYLISPILKMLFFSRPGVSRTAAISPACTSSMNRLQLRTCFRASLSSFILILSTRLSSSRTYFLIIFL